MLCCLFFLCSLWPDPTSRLCFCSSAPGLRVFRWHHELTLCQADVPFTSISDETLRFSTNQNKEPNLKLWLRSDPKLTLMSDQSAWRTSNQFHWFGITVLICEDHVWDIWWFRVISWVSVWTDFSVGFILRRPSWFILVLLKWSDLFFLCFCRFLVLGKTVKLPEFDRNDVAEAFLLNRKTCWITKSFFFTRTSSLSRTWLCIQSFQCLKLTSGKLVL